MSPRTEPGPGASPSPEVVLDLEHRDGLVLLVLANTGDATAYRPRVRFDGPVPALDGQADLAELPLWRGLALLRPGVQIEVLLGPAAGRGEQRIGATVSYADRAGREYEDRFEHDLGTYDGVPTLV